MKHTLPSLRGNFSSQNPILIIDRFGLIGEPLAVKLSKEFLVVFVSAINLSLGKENNNIIQVPFARKFPVIPDGKYSCIIFIDEDGRDLEFLTKIINKAKNINADFIFVQGLSSEGKYAVDKILRLYRSAKVVLTGDIFDKGLILRKDNFKSTVNKFIYQAKKFGKIQVLGEGLREVYPVFLEDVVDELKNLLLEKNRQDSLFHIFPKHPPTELSLVHMLQRSNPEVMVDFVKHDPRPKKTPYPVNGLNMLGENYQLAKKIKEVDINKNPKKNEEIKYVNKNTGWASRFPLFAIWVIIFLLFAPIIFALCFSFLGKNIFDYTGREVNRGNFSNVKSSLRLSQTFFLLSKQAGSIFSFQAKIIGQENWLKGFLTSRDVDYKTSESLMQAFSSMMLFSSILRGESKDPVSDLVAAENNLKSSIVALNRMRAEGNISTPILQKLETISPLIKLFSNTAEIVPNIFGMEVQKTYLILFQNNLELRPGGGVIDYYGILKLHQGKITELSIREVGEADRQLRGHIEPPFAVRRHLPSQHWYMKDSSFDVDFVESASSSANFIFAETGQKTDGVISFDTSFIQNILQAVGSVYVADYQKNVDAKNFYALMQSFAKKDFLKSLLGAIMQKTTKEKTNYLLIAQAVSDALLQKHLLLTFKDAQNIFTVNGWSSSLWDERVDGKQSVNDFMGINEANLGNNHINNFIKRQIFQNAVMGEDGNILEELSIDYENISGDSPNGDYENYLRIILPGSVNLFEILIDDRPQNIVEAIVNPLIYEEKNFKAPQGLEVEKTIQDGKAIFGFIIRVQAGKKVKVQLRYLLPGSITGSNIFSYNLKLFKQPGVNNIPYSFSLTHPNYLNVLKSFGNINSRDGKVTYSENIFEDKKIILNFATK